MKRPVIGIDARYGLQNPRRGIGEYVYQLLRHLADMPRLYDLHLFGDERADNDMVNLFRAAYRTDILKAPNFLLWEQGAFAHAAKDLDLIHGTANIGPARTRGPLVLTVHDVIEWHRGKDFGGRIPLRHHVSRFYRMNMLKYLARRSALIFTVSRHAACDIQKTLQVAAQKIVVTPLAPKYQADAVCWPKQPFVLVLGAMDPRKNLGVIMKTAALLEDRRILFKIVGIEPRHLTAVAKTHAIPANVELHPMIDDAILAELYAKAALFVYPSLYEGFGLPILEAMALGCPVLTGLNSSLPEVAGQAAVFVDPLDSGPLAQSIGEIMANAEQLWDMACQGQKQARRFSWQQTADLTHDGYQRVLAMN